MMPPELRAEWLKLYSEVLTPAEGEDDRYANEDFRSLCLGWALAKGLGPDQADEFYRVMSSSGNC